MYFQLQTVNRKHTLGSCVNTVHQCSNVLRSPDRVPLCSERADAVLPGIAACHLGNVQHHGAVPVSAAKRRAAEEDRGPQRRTGARVHVYSPSLLGLQLSYNVPW